MKILDRIAKRLGFVRSVKRKRNYAAAQVTNLTASWTTTALTSDETLRRYLRVLRARSREQIENNDYARRFVNLVKNNVVGPQGITLQARTKRSNGTQDDQANKAIEAAWKKWGRLGNCDTTRSLSWVMAQNMYIQTVVTDGEAIVRFVQGRAAGDELFRLQFIDAELLDVEYNKVLSGGNYIRMGIEFNRWAQPVAYHLIDLNNTTDSYNYGDRRYIRVDASEILHRFLPERIGQKRGIPWMSAAMLRMQMLGGYEEAALTAARVGASKMAAIATPTGDGWVGDDVAEDGSLIMDAAEPGTFMQVPEGTQMLGFDPQYPHGEFKDFVKTCLRGIASGLGISYHTLANDLEGVNFSSIRAGVLEDREAWKAIQEWEIEAFCIPVYEAWLRVYLAFGRITINNTPLFVDREEKYRDVAWQARRWAWVDPLKDVNANGEAIDRRIRSTSDVIRESGRDPDEVFQEIAEERKRMADLGIEPDKKEVNSNAQEDEGQNTIP